MKVYEAVLKEEGSNVSKEDLILCCGLFKVAGLEFPELGTNLCCLKQ